MNVYLADVSISPGGIWSPEYKSHHQLRSWGHWGIIAQSLNFSQRLVGLCLRIKLSSQNKEPGWESRRRVEASWVEERQWEESAGN